MVRCRVGSRASSAIRAAGMPQIASAHRGVLGAEPSWPRTRRAIASSQDTRTWVSAPRSIRRFGLHSTMAVPMRARGTTLGVATFSRHRRPQPFEQDDLLLAEEMTARAAVCVDNARRYTHERHTALALRRSLLPRTLPPSAAVKVASSYRPADSRSGVGGDWFDVIRLSGARVALVVGDVVGHGVPASGAMGRLRTAVRTLADVDLAPDELLTHLDDLINHPSDESENDNEGADSGRPWTRRRPWG